MDVRYVSPRLRRRMRAMVRWDRHRRMGRYELTCERHRLPYLRQDPVESREVGVELLQPILDILARHGLRTHVIRYKYHDHKTYRRLLARSRAMIFVCEHETQGLAYQEALASNVPVLAWDNGYWLDPLWKQVGNAMIPASSVPFF